MSTIEETLATQLQGLRLPDPQREYPFHAKRKWRLDFAWPEHMLAVEVEGGGWMRGRHTRGKGFRNDMEKYHAAQEQGWTIYRCDGELVNSGRASELIGRLLDDLMAAA